MRRAAAILILYLSCAEAVWDPDGSLGGRGGRASETAARAATTAREEAEQQALLGGILIVYSESATEAQIAEAQRMARQQLPRDFALAESIQVPAAGGSSSSSSGGGTSNGGSSSRISGAPPLLQVDAVDGPPLHLSRRERLRAMRQLRKLPGVESVEEDGLITEQQQQQQQQQQPGGGDSPTSAVERQSDPPSWGLSRIDQRKLPVDGEYDYPGAAGAGATVYVLDNDVDITHPEFEGRAAIGVDITKSGAVDAQGHGTHIAATVAGAAVGVAKRARVVAVQVLRGQSVGGRRRDLVAGIAWAIADCRENHNGTMCVALVSAAGGRSGAVNRAVRAASVAGLVFAVAAGACGGERG
jgi:subtilisin family serine protease